jgi:NADH-quinone oxidoreductase subunit L
VVLGVWAVLWLAGKPPGERAVAHTVADWITAGDFVISWSLLLDPLSVAMLLLVTGVGTLIHLYSIGYMAGDERYSRFFAFLNLFLASMLVLVLGESLPVLFVGWELVGLCSYLLIGFWFERRAFASAAKKAFVLNRVGDVGFLVAMFVVFGAVGSLSLTEVLPAAETVAGGALVAVGLLLLLAATGKSAQIPLYVWLPDAMAGPTPVSALIHAATMVTAGVYLVARMSPWYAQIPQVGMVVAVIGAATALVAALIACAQLDLKKILAYSTVSQLGFMFMAVGVGAYSTGIFHLLTHGFFKALLFLAAGAVMHAMGERTDVRIMGGLARHMPVTAVTAGIATLAIAGFPLTAGFYSKEEIFTALADSPGAGGILVVALAAAALTAFYMARWFWLVFLGPPRWGENPAPVPGPGPGYPAAVPETPREVHPHDGDWTMSVPLVLLAVGSAAGGVLNLDLEAGLLATWLAPASVVPFEPGPPIIGHTPLEVIAVVLTLGGLAVGVWRYRAGPLAPSPAVAPTVGFALNAFRVDDLYRTAIVTPGRWVADGAVWVDVHVVDGAVNGLGRATCGLAGGGRRLQTGFVRSYALAVLLGTVVVLALLAGGTLTAFFLGVLEVGG